MKCTNSFWLLKSIKTDIKNINLNIIIGATINLSIGTNIIQELNLLSRNSPVTVEISPLRRTWLANFSLAPLSFFRKAETVCGLGWGKRKCFFFHLKTYSRPSSLNTSQCLPVYTPLVIPSPNKTENLITSRSSRSHLITDKLKDFLNLSELRLISSNNVKEFLRKRH